MIYRSRLGINHEYPLTLNTFDFSLLCPVPLDVFLQLVALKAKIWTSNESPEAITVKAVALSHA